MNKRELCTVKFRSARLMTTFGLCFSLWVVLTSAHIIIGHSYRFALLLHLFSLCFSLCNANCQYSLETLSYIWVYEIGELLVSHYILLICDKHHFIHCWGQRWIFQNIFVLCISRKFLGSSCKGQKCRFNFKTAIDPVPF